MTTKEAIKGLKENLCGMCAYGSQDMDSCDIRGCDNRDYIKVLEQEPKTGHWEEYGHNLIDNFIWDGVRCSCCKRPARLKDFIIRNGEPPFLTYNSYSLTNYCPYCGAKMVESQESEDKENEID